MARRKTKQKPEIDINRVTTSGDIEVSTYLEIAKEMGGEQPVVTEEALPGVKH